MSMYCSPDEQPEFGFLARRFAPSAGALTGELHAHADFRPHAVGLGVFQNEMDFFVVLDHGDDGAAELGGQDDGLYIGVVLEAIAYHDAVGRVFGDGHDGEQFGLGADFEAEAEFLPVAIHLFDHEPLLVDLDGKHRGVAVLVAVLGNGRTEGFGQVAQAVGENVGKANDHGRVQVAGLETLNDLHQVDFALGIHARPDHHMACVVDGKVALAPGFHLVQVQRLFDFPGIDGKSFGGCVHVARKIANWCCM
jgi:hypothetical protein